MFSKVKAEVDEKVKQRKMQELKPKHNQKLQQSKNPSFTTIEDGFFRFDHNVQKDVKKSSNMYIVLIMIINYSKCENYIENDYQYVTYSLTIKSI